MITQRQLPKQGTVTWPSFEAIPLREKILLESKTIKELCDAITKIPRDEWEAELGWFEYLHTDWRWLHEPDFRAQAPHYRSAHKILLRECHQYAHAIGWKSKIPETDEIIEGWDSLLN